MRAAQALRDGATTRNACAAMGAEPIEGDGALPRGQIPDATATWGELIRGLAIRPEKAAWTIPLGRP